MPLRSSKHSGKNHSDPNQKKNKRTSGKNRKKKLKQQKLNRLAKREQRLKESENETVNHSANMGDLNFDPCNSATFVRTTESCSSFPIRPLGLSEKGQYILDKKCFEQYLKCVNKTNYQQINPTLHQMQQIWMSCEKADFILVAADIRFIALHFCDAISKFIKQYEKPTILILNKSDLVPQEVIDMWIQELKSTHPWLLNVIPFEKSTCNIKLIQQKNLLFECINKNLNKIIDPNSSQFTSGDLNSDQNRRHIKLENCEKEIILSVVGIVNSGKSSIINTILEDSTICKVSGTPGKTKNLKACCYSFDKDNNDATVAPPSSSAPTTTTNKSSIETNISSTTEKKVIYQKQIANENDLNDDIISDDFVNINYDAYNEDEDDLEELKITENILGFVEISMPHEFQNTNVNNLKETNHHHNLIIESKEEEEDELKEEKNTFTLSPVHTDFLFLDTPGIIVPFHVPLSIQTIAGLYPVSQVRDPYVCVGSLGKQTNLVRVLNLTIPKEVETETFTWTPYEICEQYALKRKYRAKGGFADAFRGANEILRRHLEGKYGQFWGPTEL